MNAKDAGKQQKIEKTSLNEDVIRNYFDNISTVDAFEEHKILGKKVVDRPSVEWQKNRKRGAKCFDHSRVRLDDPKLFVNASSVSSSPYILAKFPEIRDVKDNEIFWTMVFEKKASIHIILSLEEVEILPKLFKTVATGDEKAMIRFDSITIDTRSVELDFLKNSPKIDKYHVEVLPSGCSNSYVSEVYVHVDWPREKGPHNLHSFHQAAKFVNDSTSHATSTGIAGNVVLCSTRGTGRNATLLALATAVKSLQEGKVPNIRSIVSDIRKDRCGAVETDHQHGTLYLATNSFILACLPPDCDTKTIFKEVASFGDRLAQTARMVQGIRGSGAK